MSKKLREPITRKKPVLGDGTNEADLDGFKQRLVNSRIPTITHSKVLSDFGEAGEDLRKRLQSPSGFRVDTVNGMGTCIFGIEGKVSRFELFATYCKSIVGIGESIVFATLHDLLTSMEYNNSDYEDYCRTHHLAIARFEKDGPFPFSNYQRSMIENFIEARASEGLPLHIESIREPRLTEWWSRDFAAYLSSKLINYQVL